MDPTPSPLARAGQVFWTVLNFVTGAVRRYLTPEPTNTGNYDTRTGQEAPISVATETPEWSEGDKNERENNEDAEKKIKDVIENVPDVCDSECKQATSWEQCTTSTAAQADRKTDQEGKDINNRMKEKVTERGEDIGNKLTTQRERKVKGPQFTDEKKEREIERCSSISKHVVQPCKDVNNAADIEISKERQTGKEIGSEKYRELSMAFNTSDGTERGNKISGGKELGEALKGERTITDFLGVETGGGSLQRIDGDQNNKSECKVRKFETNLDEVGTILKDGAETDYERNKIPTHTHTEEESEKYESKPETGTGKKIDCNVGGWRDVSIKEIGSSDMDGVKAITDLKTTELSQAEFTVGKKENESDKYSVQDEMKSNEIRKVESENSGIKGITEEWVVVAGEKESKNVMAKREEQETKTIIENKQENERHMFKEPKEEPLVVQGSKGNNLALEVEDGAVGEEVNSQKELKAEKITKDIGQSEYGGEMERKMWGTEEKVDDTDVRPESMMPIPFGRSDKGVLNKETHSDVEKDHFNMDSETEKYADEKYKVMPGTDEDERITEIDGNENNLREIKVLIKEKEQSEGESEDQRIESAEMRKTETEEKDINKIGEEIENIASMVEIDRVEVIWQEGKVRGEMQEELGIKAHTEGVHQKGERLEENIQRQKRGGSSIVEKVNAILDRDRQGKKDDEGISMEEQGQFLESMTEEKQENRGNDLDQTVEIEGGAVDAEEDAKEEKEEEEMILKEETGGKFTKKFGEHEYCGEMETSMSDAEENVDEIEVRPELKMPIPVGQSDKGVLNEETHSDVETDNITKEPETDKDEAKKHIGILRADEVERITDIGKNENSLREMMVMGKENKQRKRGRNEDQGMESAKIWKTETEEKDQNKSGEEMKNEESTTEMDKVEGIWQEGKVRGEMQEEIGIKAHTEGVHQRGTLELLPLEEGEEFTGGRLEENIQREKRRGSSNVVQINAILHRDREERKGNEEISEEEQGQVSESMTEGKQGNGESDVDPVVEIEGGAVDAEEDAKEEKEEEEMIFKEETGGKFTKEFGEHEYCGQMEVNMLGTEENVDEIEVRTEPKMPIPVRQSDKGVLNEETYSDVGIDNLTNETETGKDAAKKDIGILHADEDERITDIGRNENSLREIMVMSKENEQRKREGGSEDQGMESAEMRKTETEVKDKDKSGEETENEESTAEVEKVEAIWQDEEIGGEMKEEEEKGIDAHSEEVCHTETLEKLALEEGDELKRDGWKADIQRERKRQSSNGMQVNLILDGDSIKKKRKGDEGMSEEKQRWFSGLMTDGKQGNGENDVDPTVDIEGGAVDAEEDAKEEKEEEGMILKEAKGGKFTEEFGEHEYCGEMEGNMLGTEENVDEIEVRPEPRMPIPVGQSDKGVLNEETDSDVEIDHFIKETETNKDTAKKDILSADKDERFIDNCRNENSLREKTAMSKEKEQRKREVASEDQGMENAEMRKDETEEKEVDQSGEEIEDEESTAEVEKVEAIWQKGEIRGEKGIKAHTEEIHHKKSQEKLALEEEVDLTGERLEEIIQRDKKGGSVVQVNAILDGDRQDRKGDEGISVEEQEQFSESMTEEKQGNRGNDLDETVEIEGGAVDAEEDAKEEKEEEEMILKEETGWKFSNKVGELEYNWEMEANMWGTGERVDETEMRPGPMLPIPVGRSEKCVLNEKANSYVEINYFIKPTGTDMDSHEKNIGIPSIAEDERITDIGRNGNILREMTGMSKENEQRKKGGSEDQGMESAEMKKTETEVKDMEKSGEGIENEESIAEVEKIEAIRQEVEIRNELEKEEEKGIKAHSEKVCHKGTLEKLALEEGDELKRDRWKANIQREKIRGISNDMQVNIIFDGDRQERKGDEEISVEEQGCFSELITEAKQGSRGNDFDPTVQKEGEAVDEEEDGKEEKEEEEEGTILLEASGGKLIKEVKHEYRREMEANMWDTAVKVDEIEGRPDVSLGKLRNIFIQKGQIRDKQKAALKGEEAEMTALERNYEEVKLTERYWEEFIDRETEEKITRLENKEPEGLNVKEENEIADKWMELHPPSLDFTAQKSRIALKNTHSRPPMNPRALIHTQSLLPTPSKSQQSGQLNTVPTAKNQGGPIITGFKLLGMGGEFPALKRTLRGVREKGEGVTTEMLTSGREEKARDKAVGMGVIGVKLPGFSAEFPGLKKTERGVKMRETSEKKTTSCDNNSERSDMTGTDSIKGIAVPAVKLTGFGPGFPVLRKTNRGVMIRGEDAQCCTQKNITGVDHQESQPKAKWTPPVKPGLF